MRPAHLTVPAALLAVAAACAPAEVDIPYDDDGDGLLSHQEAAAGTDPLAWDSDGDGHGDGAEVDGGTDPLDPADHPPGGGWVPASCADDLTGTGDAPGEVAHDFTLVDQYGDDVRLYDFCDKAVLLVSSAVWCGTCRAEAPELQRWWQDYRDDGLVVLTLLGEGNDSQPSESEDQDVWVDLFGLTHPVVADPGWGVTVRYVSGGTIALPSMHLIGPGAEVISVDAWVSESDVVGALPE